MKGVGYRRTTIREPITGSALYRWGIGHRDYDTDVRQEFRVPIGTVEQNFKVQ